MKNVMTHGKKGKWQQQQVFVGESNGGREEGADEQQGGARRADVLRALRALCLLRVLRSLYTFVSSFSLPLISASIWRGGAGRRGKGKEA